MKRAMIYTTLALLIGGCGSVAIWGPIAGSAITAFGITVAEFINPTPTATPTIAVHP